MKLDAATIAQLARDAGFDRDDVVTATAVALATSGGLTHHERVSPYSAHNDAHGLWGLTPMLRADVDGCDWYDPTSSAVAVKKLHRIYDGWSWSPAYRSGAYEAFVPHAATEASRVMYRQPARNVSRVPSAIAQTDNERSRRRRLYANLLGRFTIKGR